MGLERIEAQFGGMLAGAAAQQLPAGDRCQRIRLQQFMQHAAVNVCSGRQPQQSQGGRDDVE
jgi:hypothetical protein